MGILTTTFETVLTEQLINYCIKKKRHLHMLKYTFEVCLISYLININEKVRQCCAHVENNIFKFNN